MGCGMIVWEMGGPTKVLWVYVTKEVRVGGGRRKVHYQPWSSGSAIPGRSRRLLEAVQACLKFAENRLKTEEQEATNKLLKIVETRITLNSHKEVWV